VFAMDGRPGVGTYQVANDDLSFALGSWTCWNGLFGLLLRSDTLLHTSDWSWSSRLGGSSGSALARSAAKILCAATSSCDNAVESLV
jgi:hypothetical protein